MNGVIYYLLTSFTAKRKNKAMKSTKQNAVKADYYHWLAIPICFGLKDSALLSATFSKFFRQTTSPSQPLLAKQQQIWDILIENQNNNKYSSSKCTYREDGVRAWPKTTGHAPPFTEIIRNWSKEHHHQPLLLQKHECNNDSFLLLNFFLISFVYKRECLPNRTKGMTTMT